MHCRLVIATFLVTTAALAQEPGTKNVGPATAVVGRDNPDLIPEWVALQSVLVQGQVYDASYQDGAALFARTIGISEESARTLIAHQNATPKGADLSQLLCPKRHELESTDALNREITRSTAADRAQLQAHAEKVYSLISVEDADKLRTFALQTRKHNTMIKASGSIDNPVDFLNALCGDAS